MPSERTIKDLTRPLGDHYHLTEDDPLREAVRLLRKAKMEKRPECLIVLAREQTEERVITGFVTPREIVFGLVTRFLSAALKSGPIFWEGQFQAECAEGLDKQVRDIMAPITAVVRPSGMLMEAVFLLHTRGADLLPVTDAEGVVGTISIDDVFDEIAGFTPAERGASNAPVS